MDPAQLVYNRQMQRRDSSPFEPAGTPPLRNVALALVFTLLYAPLAQAQPQQTAAPAKPHQKPKTAAKKPAPAPKPEPTPASAPAQPQPQAQPAQEPEKPADQAQAGTAAPPAAPVQKLDRAEIVKRANAFFNASPVMIADFVQIGGDGKRAEGKLYVQRAGRLRFEYAAPATLEVVSDGAQVLIRDRKLKSQTLYFIDQTPLKFLMKEKIDLEHDVTVLNTAMEDSGAHLLLEDKTAFGGVSKIHLVFDGKTFKLKQWQITDPQGNETQLSLYNIDQKSTPDPTLFKIDAAKND